MSLPYAVSQKLVISGQFIESYEYEKPYWVGFPRFRSYRSKTRRLKPVAEQESIRDDNVRRTRIKIRRLVNSNQDLIKFMTLTFDSETYSLDIANKHFNLFIKRLVRLYPYFKYLCVPEFQPKSKRVHYHLLCNIEFISRSDLEHIWGNGFVFIRKVDSVDNLGAYVCKYLGKANFDSRYFRKRKFFYSFNLLRPVIIDDIKEVIRVLDNLPLSISCFVKEVFSFDFLTRYLGMIKYKQYKISDILKVV